MHPQAHQLIGKSVQMVETTQRGVVTAVADAALIFTISGTVLTFEDGSKGLYRGRDIASMLIDGTHLMCCE